MGTYRNWLNLALAVLAVACSPVAGPAPGAGAPKPGAAPPKEAPVVAQPTVVGPPETVVVALNPQLPAAPVLIGIDKGAFAAQGVEIRIERAESAAEVFQALAAGQVDIGRGAITAGTFNAFIRGVEFKIMATGHADNPQGPGQVSLLVRKALADSGTVKGPADLKGRKVAINGVGGGAEYALGKALAKGGLSLEDVDITTMPFPDMVPALGSGAIDGAIGVEPQSTLAVSRGFAVKLDDRPTPGSQTTVLFFGDKFLKERRPVALRFMLAYIKSIRDLQGDRLKTPENVAILSKYSAVAPEVISEAPAAYWHPDGRVNKEDLLSQQGFFLDRGHMKERVSVDAMVDESLIQEALRILGPSRP